VELLLRDDWIWIAGNRIDVGISLKMSPMCFAETQPYSFVVLLVRIKLDGLS